MIGLVNSLSIITVITAILKVAVMFVLLQVQVWTLQTLLSFAQSRAGVKRILNIGVTAEKLYLLTEYNSVCLL